MGGSTDLMMGMPCCAGHGACRAPAGRGPYHSAQAELSEDLPLPSPGHRGCCWPMRRRAQRRLWREPRRRRGGWAAARAGRLRAPQRLERCGSAAAHDEHLARQVSAMCNLSCESVRTSVSRHRRCKAEYNSASWWGAWQESAVKYLGRAGCLRRSCSRCRGSGRSCRRARATSAAWRTSARTMRPTPGASVASP
jgi:hypothetical protein